MALVLGKLKCYFCGGKGGVLESVHQYGIYGEIGGRYYYHSECLQAVQISPEKYGHIWADKAIHLSELEERNKKDYNNTVVSDFEKKVDKLHAFHFQKMMPKK